MSARSLMQEIDRSQLENIFQSITTVSDKLAELENRATHYPLAIWDIPSDREMVLEEIDSLRKRIYESDLSQARDNAFAHAFDRLAEKSMRPLNSLS